MGSGVLAALDIGTYNISAAIFSIKDGEAEIIACGESPALGMKRGSVCDIDACARSIATAVKEAEKTAGFLMPAAFVGFSGCSISSTNVVSGIDILDPAQGVTDVDLQLLMESCRAGSATDEMILVQQLPIDYGIDGCWGLSQPRGAKGKRLEAEVHLVYGQAEAINNLLASLHRGNIRPKALYYNPLVLADQVLQHADKQLGALLVDLGGATTDLCWYHRGLPRMTLSLPIGGEHITGDLAIGLHVPISVAAKIKIDNNENKGMDTKTNQFINEIIDSRVTELADMIENSINTYGHGARPTKLVLIGGGAKLKGLPGMLEGNLNLPVHLIDEQEGVHTSLNAVALIKYGQKNHMGVHDKKSNLLARVKGGFKSVIHKFTF
ncbi:cell division protein FtsA [Desulfofalx alkaliphila]|uniref:cell division protein FtsA n=1 Tax=Desulfofalx alkaliphila TaxID=105483 RepID=UPI0004E0F8A1|nr:cell division protein FtsA [Desulfofalx alkaliphila]